MKNIKKPYFKKPIDSLYETMNDKGESVVRFRSNDNRERFIGTSLDPNKVPGGDTPSPSPMPSGGGMVEVTWQELKDKRDNGELNPGSLYRITDYNCTTTQESTRSAGHQFDIVLLALSNNKLAEEGWAMMHDNIYDVTFSDGVTKKCYLYKVEENNYNFVDSQTLLGVSLISDSEFTIDESAKTITTEDYESNILEEEGLLYNYFQNSNLSAWKVWYCLDNDTTLFTWADDSVDLSVVVDNSYVRFEVEDRDGKFCWHSDRLSNLTWTDSETPSIGDNRYLWNNRNNKWVSDGTVQNVETSGTGLPNGRGVIYRLIDEWNNDVAYDFKNIQFVRPLTDGQYDPEGEDTWVYTLNNVTAEQDIYDASLNTTSSDNSTNNKIDSLYTFINDKNYFQLPDVVILYGGNSNNISMSQIITILQNVVKMQSCQDCIIGNADSQFYSCGTLSTTEKDDAAIYINNKKVLTEE